MQQPHRPWQEKKYTVQSVVWPVIQSMDLHMTGPSFKGAFGHEVTVVTGGKERTIKVDEAYIKKSILEPNADIVKGFNANLMQSYKGQLSDQEIENIIEFIKSLK